MNKEEIGVLQAVKAACLAGDAAAAAETAAGYFGLGSRGRDDLAAVLSEIAARRVPGLEKMLPLCGDDRARLAVRSWLANFDRFILAGHQRDADQGIIPSELDFYAHPPKLNAVNLVVKLANSLVEKTRDTLLVCTVRNEGPWLLEWIAFYKLLGFDDIVLAFNDIDDKSDLLIRNLAAAGEIVAFENLMGSPRSPQKKAYNYLLNLEPWTYAYRWLAFFDADEFLWPLLPSCLKVADMLAAAVSQHAGSSAPAADAVAAVLFHWRWFSGATQFAWEPGLVIERFQRSNAETWVKTVARPEALWSMDTVHYPVICDPGAVIDDSGGVVGKVDCQVGPASYAVAQLNHYFSKSFQEFVLKKSRGRGAGGSKAQERAYTDFLWGRSSGKQHPLPNRWLIEATLKEVERLKALPGVAAAHEATEAWARARIQEIGGAVDLRRLFDEITEAAAVTP